MCVPHPHQLGADFVARRTPYAPGVESEPVLLTGASGLLGTWLRQVTPADTEVVSVTHRRRLPGGAEVVVDLRDRGAVSAAFARVRPGLVIHAGYARDEASIVDATQNIVEMAHEVDADLLYISSDAVFSGDGLPRDEAARPDPVWDYGRWKASAEASVVQSCDHEVIRAAPTPPSARRPRDLKLSDGRAREQLDWSPTRVLATSTPRPPAVR